MFWFVLNKRSIGDETARCLPNISHFDLAEIRPSIGFGYNAPQHGDHTTTCAPDQCLRGERGVAAGAKSLHLYDLREGCATNECRRKGTLIPAHGLSWLAISDRSFGYSAISMRRFAVRPSSVSLPASGLVSAYPTANRLARSTPPSSIR